MYFSYFSSVFFVVAWLVSQAGCEEIRKATKKSWHEKFNWKAELYFEDPQVIALCKAIEAEDLKEIDRLVAAGANVNAKGKGKMTPLLWAYPDNKPERFKRLLEHGANPNIIFDSDFNAGKKISFAGRSVTHMASGTWFPKYFDYVFQHGGDPNLEQTSKLKRGETPLLALIGGGAADKTPKVERLIELKANLNHQRSTGMTAVSLAVGRGRYDVALLLLQAEANYRVYNKSSNVKLIHQVITGENELSIYTAQQKKDYKRLVQWLKDHGEDFDEARADLKRWRSWSTLKKDGKKSEYRRKMDAEIAVRKAREKHEKEAANREAQVAE